MRVDLIDSFDHRLLRVILYRSKMGILIIIVKSYRRRRVNLVFL